MSLRVVVHPPDDEGGRRVRIDGTILGRATSMRDLVEFLRRAGLELDPEGAALSSLVEWRGGGPEVWGAEQ
ncbi:hypothetical protein [Streptomyces sp. NRRL S-378]|uniref:hypothetical protein n=1 Tax=Streptomyces sp. NRRL S-378 TaxID=1463904 RepID=UPI0004C68B21|nr:hypothetical protein [Streptomyces sp. NRRL S-378]